MVLITCLIVSSPPISRQNISELFLNDHFLRHEEFSLNDYIIINLIFPTAAGDQAISIPCRIVGSLQDSDTAKLQVPHFLRPYASAELIEVEIRVLPFRLYAIPQAKFVVISVPLNLQKFVSLSTLRLQLSNHIISNNQVIRYSVVPYCREMMEGINLSVSHVGGDDGIAYLAERQDNHLMFKVTRFTQIILQPESDVCTTFGFQGKVNESSTALASFAFGEDVYNAVKAFIANSCKHHARMSEKKMTTDAAVNSVSSVLLVGQSGVAKSRLVIDEAKSMSVSVVKICPALLLQLEESTVVASLNSFFVSALLRQPCVILIERLELLRANSTSSCQIINVITNFLQHVSSKHNNARKEVMGRSSSHFDNAKNIFSSAKPQVLVFGCAETTGGVDINLLNAFEEKISLPSSLSSTCARRVLEHVTGEDYETTSKSLQILSGKFKSQLSLMDFMFHCHNSLRRRSQKSSSEEMAGQDFSESILEQDDGYVFSHDGIISGVQDVILIPRQFPEIFREYNIPPPTGILLYGPCGTGKTLLVKSIVKQLRGAFLNIRLSDVMSGSVGEASASIRDFFVKAKKHAPSLVFIDEFQALFSSRDLEKKKSGGSGESDSSLIFTLIGCLDDIVSWNSNAGPAYLVTVIAATNEPWAVDDILLRSGRFDKIIFVGPMTSLSRKELLERLVGRDIRNVTVDIDYDEIVRHTEGFTGADMNILFQKASSLFSDLIADDIKRSSIPTDTKNKLFNNYYFDCVLSDMRSSCSADEVSEYESWGKEFQAKIW